MLRAGISVRALLVAIVLACCVSAVAQAEKRVALVIGNSGYEHAPQLPNTKNDATDMAAALERLGFDVTLQLDQGYQGMRIALSDFADAAIGADIATVFYAGHGIEVDRENFLIPVDARLNTDRKVRFETIALDDALLALEGAKGLQLVILDACRENPFSSSMRRTSATRSIGRGLARVQPQGSSVLVAFAAKEGQVAADGDGRNSPFTEALLKHVEDPGLEVGRLFRKVREDVYEATQGQQQPFTYGSLPGDDIYLKQEVETQPAEPESPNVGTAIAADFRSAAQIGTTEAWVAFIKKHDGVGDEVLLDVARDKLSSLMTSAASQNLATPAHSAGSQEQAELGSVSSGIGEAVELDLEGRRQVQLALTKLGYNPGPADGVFGAQTRRAIGSARRELGLPSGEEVDVAMMRRLPRVIDDRYINIPWLGTYLSIGKGEIDKIDSPEFKILFEKLIWRLVIAELHGGRLLILVRDIVSWETADQVAKSVGGRLVEIRDSETNRFLKEMIPERAYAPTGPKTSIGPCFGLHRDQRLGWVWASDGSRIGYSDWLPNSPDNDKPKADIVTFQRHNGRLGWANRDPGHCAGYIIEYPS